jgi:hypothetical protein
MGEGGGSTKRSLYAQMRIMPFSQCDLPSFTTLLTVKTNEKNAISRNQGWVAPITSRSFTGEKENDRFEKIEKECQRLAQDPS